MRIIYAQSTMYRKPEYSVVTQIAEADGERFVLKKALTREAVPFVNGLEKNYQEMVTQYGEEHVAKGELLSPGVFKMEYVDGETLATNSMRYFATGDFDGFIQNIAYYYSNILVGFEDNPAAIAEPNPLSAKRKYNLDLNFNNIILAPDFENFKIIDYEWLLPSLSKQYVCVRILTVLYNQYIKAFNKKNMTWEMLLSGCMLGTKDIEHYNKEERRFYKNVLDWTTKKNEKNMFRVNL